MSNPLSVIQITDTHLQSRAGARLWGIDVDHSLTRVLTHLRRRHWPADLILATGDLVQDEGLPAYRRFRDYFEPLNTPVYCLPGNHDVVGELARAFPADSNISAPRHVIRGPWQFILLDSAVPGSPAGHLEPRELDFLDQTLRRHHLHTVVCLHHQPRDITSAWLDTMTVDNGGDLFTILDQYPQVRAVVFGHIHQDFSDRRNGVALLGAPSTCVQFKPGLTTAEADPVPPGYRWFRLYPEGGLETGVERAT